MVQKSGITRGGNTSFVNRERERPLTGKVNDLKAAEGEERLARTFNKSLAKGVIRDYKFRWTTLRRGIVGYKELDFLVISNIGPVALSVKGTDFVHKSAKSQAQDKINELLIMTRLNCKKMLSI